MSGHYNHFYFLEFVTVTLLLVLVYVLYVVHSSNRGHSSNREMICQFYESAAQSSVTANVLMQSKTQSDLYHALRLVERSIVRIETIQRVFGTNQIASLTKIHQPERVLSVLKEQRKQIETQLRFQGTNLPSSVLDEACDGGSDDKKAESG